MQAPMAYLGDYAQGPPSAPRFSLVIPTRYHGRGEDLTASGRIENISKW